MDMDIFREMVEEGIADSMAEGTVSQPMLPDSFAVYAFSDMTRSEIVVNYPVAANGWVFRVDLSSRVSLRWEHSDALALVTRSDSCEKSIYPREKCRSCENKHLWRQRCTNKCDLFYLVAIEGRTSATSVLAAVTKRQRALTPECQRLYLKSIPPKASLRHERKADSEALARKAYLAEHEFRTRLLRSQSGPIVQDRPMAELSTFESSSLQTPAELAEAVAALLDDELTEDTFGDLLSPASSSTVVTPAHTDVVVSPRRDPSSSVVRATTVRRADDMQAVSDSYAILMERLVPGVQTWRRADVDALMQRPFGSPTIRLSRCDALLSLGAKFGCKCAWAQAIHQPGMTAFLETLRVAVEEDGLCHVGVGLYRAPTSTAYDRLCAKQLDGVVLVNSSYDAQTVDPPDVRPVVVVYHATSGSSFVPAAEVVPCGVLGV